MREIDAGAEHWLESLRRALAGPLPGVRAHEPLRARPLGPLVPSFQHAQPPRKGSVLLLLCADAAGFRIPFIKRPLYSGMHSGQISLPGGKAEAGETPVQTALREASEEIGVDPALVKVAGTLTDFYVIPSNILVTPVVGVVPCRPVYRPDVQEVVKVIEGNLADLLADDAVKEKEIEVGGLYRMLAPHFEVEGEVVWGATAMILNEFRMVMNELRASV